MSKLKIYTATVSIGGVAGTGEGFYKKVLTVEATSTSVAKKKALKLALSSTDVVVELTRGIAVGTNPIYEATFGKNPEDW